MEVNSQLHVPAILIPLKGPKVPIWWGPGRILVPMWDKSFASIISSTVIPRSSSPSQLTEENHVILQLRYSICQPRVECEWKMFCAPSKENLVCYTLVNEVRLRIHKGMILFLSRIFLFPISIWNRILRQLIFLIFDSPCVPIMYLWLIYWKSGLG
jgi:hypothetical protein